MKLPVTFEATVTSSNRVTIPTWLTFIEAGDIIEGTIQLLDQNATYPFEKKLSFTRHITVGHIKAFLPMKELPSRLEITVLKVHKTVSESLDFNLVGYKEDNNNYLMNYSTIKPESAVQFSLDNATETFVQSYFSPEYSETESVDPVYLEEEKKWIITHNLLLEDEMGAKIPVVLYLVLSQDFYQKYNDKIKNVNILIKRFTDWIFNINDFNKETLSKLSSQLQEILAQNNIPDYLEMRAILKLPTLQREIVLLVLKEHRTGGVTLENLIKQLRESENNVETQVNELVKKGILREFEENKSRVIDTLWVL